MFNLASILLSRLYVVVVYGMYAVAVNFSLGYVACVSWFMAPLMCCGL
jgi:hypothetical protein